MEENSTYSHNVPFAPSTNSPFSSEMIRPLVQAYLDELKSIKLETIELWSVEKAVQAIVSQSSMEIRNLSTKMLIEKCTQNTDGRCEDGPLAPMDKVDDYLASITEIGIRNITRILEDLVNEFSPINENEDISDDEYRQILHTVIQDTMESASDIVRIIMGCVPTRRRKLDKKSLIKVRRRSTVFFFCRFAKEFVICLVAKLKKQHLFCSPDDSDASIMVLLDKVDWLMEKLLPKMEDKQTEGTVECHFTQIAKEIEQEQLNVFNKQLAYSLVLYLKPSPNLGMRFRRQVQDEADALIDELFTWLHQQAAQHEMKTDLTSAAMKKIEKVTENLLALADGLEEKDSSSVASTPSPDEDFEKSQSMPDYWKYPFQVCQFMAVKLVNAFVNPCAIHIYWYNVNSIVGTLTERLFSEIRDCEIVGEVNDSNAEALFKEMKKDLSGEGKCSCWVQMALLCNDPYFFEYAIDMLKKHLVSPQKSLCIFTFLKRLYRRPLDTSLLGPGQERALLWQKLDIPDLGNFDFNPEGSNSKL